MITGGVVGSATRLWFVAGMIILFTMLLWQRSTGAGLNIYDLVISFPALCIVLPCMLSRGWFSRRVAIRLLPLLAFVAWALISIIWADQPDISKTVRAAVQVLALFCLFFYMRVVGGLELLKKALFLACVAGALVCLWHVVVVYGVIGAPWSATLYEDIDSALLVPYGVKPVNAMHATMMAAPQAALLLGLVVESEGSRRKLVGLFSLLAICLYLIALERRTGQLAIIIALIISAAIYRYRYLYYFLGAVVFAAMLVFFFAPDFILSRGVSWRPEIWASTLASIADFPAIGHGVSNTLIPVYVDAQDSSMQIFDHPHNMILSVAYFTGGLGLLLWCLSWIPATLHCFRNRAVCEGEKYIVVMILVGATVLLFDGGTVLAPFHFDWFSFWIPVLLLNACRLARNVTVRPLDDCERAEDQRCVTANKIGNKV